MAVFRFAPSPNGRLHLGHAYSALLNLRLAEAAGGRLLLRIEDIDRERCRPEYEAGIHEDLAWLGIAFDGPARRQSEHFADYAAALDRLRGMGLVYPAFLSRAEIARFVAERQSGGRAWHRDPDGSPLFPPVDRDRPASDADARLRAGEPHALRLDMAKALAVAGPLDWRESGGGARQLVPAEPAAWGDVILAGRETPTSYHLSVVVDDALQEVTDVVRGRDLFAATSVHRLLQKLLGLPAPRYHHHRLIADESGRKLAKSSNDTGLAELRAAGLTPDEVRQRVGLAAPGGAAPRQRDPA
ncbi:MAG: tRNA glutamyl-Q(34) synthetase GluQRS [Bauldia sp.]|nr:tRNA glutamyl-Q(34) synthetase GluQRS [Bauldia sp.]